MLPVILIALISYSSYLAVTSTMLLNVAAAIILTALLIFTALLNYIATVTSAMLLSAAAAIILAVLLMLNKNTLGVKKVRGQSEATMII